MAKISGGGSYLGEHLCKNDYYSDGEKVTGEWVGRLAERWKIVGEEIGADDSRFENLRNNLSPDGAEKLTQRTKPLAVKFFDWQLSARKSVSVMGLFDPRIRAAHEKAAGEAFSELEKFAGRRLKDEAGRSVDLETTGTLCAARFMHDTSRALDPQLHTHFVVANVTESADGRRFALDPLQQCRAVDFCGRAYHAAMARELRGMGYNLDRIQDGKNVGYEISGVSPETLEKFSRRRSDIEAAISAFRREKGYEPSKAQIDVITRATRGRKLTEISTAEVREGQFARMSAEEKAGLSEIAAAARTAAPAATPPLDLETATKAAIDHLEERQSVFLAHEVAAVVLREHAEAGLSVQEVNRAIVAAGLIPLKGDGLGATVTTAENLSRERQSIDRVNDGLGKFDGLGTVRGEISEKLSADQQKVVREILASKDFAVSVRGPAGAGKTTTLQELDKHLQASSRQTLFLAPTTGAVEVLSGEGFRAHTLSRFLVSSGHPDGKALRPGSVLVVDEAGLASSKQGADLLRLAAENKARVVFVGDTRQHSAVEAGDFVRVLETHSSIHKSELSEIWRQRGNKEYLAAANLLAAGQRSAAFEKFDSMGVVQECGRDYLDAAAAAWLAKDKKAREETIVISPTWAEIDRLTDRIRDGLKADGTLSDGQKFRVTESLGWTESQKKNWRNFEPGQVVTYTTGKNQGLSLKITELSKEGGIRLSDGSRLDRRAAFDVGREKELEISPGDKLLIRGNVKTLGIRNGETVTVRAAGEKGLSIEKNDGKKVLLPETFRQFSHGYAVTSHKSQGMTKHGAILAASSLDGKALTVAASRGKMEIQIFCPEKEKLKASIQASGDRQAAVDFRPPSLTARRAELLNKPTKKQKMTPEEARKYDARQREDYQKRLSEDETRKRDSLREKAKAQRVSRKPSTSSAKTEKSPPQAEQKAVVGQRATVGALHPDLQAQAVRGRVTSPFHFKPSPTTKFSEQKTALEIRKTVRPTATKQKSAADRLKAQRTTRSKTEAETKNLKK